MTSLPAARRRSPGRPRDAVRDEKILGAVLRLLESGGYGELSIAAIAREAGVGKPTVYLRWRSKAAVVAEAVAESMRTEPFPDTGILRDDLIGGLREMSRRLESTPAGLALPGLIADLNEDNALRKAFEDRYFRPRRGHVRLALQRGIDRGELPSGSDVELLIDCLVGPVYHHRLLHPTSPAASTTDLVDLVLAGARAHWSGGTAQRSGA